MTELTIVQVHQLWGNQQIVCQKKLRKILHFSVASEGSKYHTEEDKKVQNVIMW